MTSTLAVEDDKRLILHRETSREIITRTRQAKMTERLVKPKVSKSRCITSQAGLHE